MLRVLREQGLSVWFTGLSGAGKTTLCRAVETELLAVGMPIEILDGDEIRKYLCKDLGFSREDREENIDRIAFVARLLARNGVIVLIAAIAPYQATRERARKTIGDMIEVHVNAPLHVCESRDPKGLYKKARAGIIKGFTGVDDPYEPATEAEITCNTEYETVRESTIKVTSYIQRHLSAGIEVTQVREELRH